MKGSIIQKEKECWFCGRTDGLERHHVFGGVANRKISESYGMTVWLCHEHHTGSHGAQYDREKNLELKRAAQAAFQTYYGKPLWMRLIRKDYIGRE
jgi:hypothetical protein